MFPVLPVALSPQVQLPAVILHVPMVVTLPELAVVSKFYNNYNTAKHLC